MLWDNICQSKHRGYTLPVEFDLCNFPEKFYTGLDFYSLRCINDYQTIRNMKFLLMILKIFYDLLHF